MVRTFVAVVVDVSSLSNTSATVYAYLPCYRLGVRNCCHCLISLYTGKLLRSLSLSLSSSLRFYFLLYRSMEEG